MSIPELRDCVNHLAMISANYYTQIFHYINAKLAKLDMLYPKMIGAGALDGGYKGIKIGSACGLSAAVLLTKNSDAHPSNPLTATTAAIGSAILGGCVGAGYGIIQAHQQYMR